ncbi:MAG: hypothetical protein RLZZ127_487 [Planctomycetota bacterium]|jgi:hypothetical protein
MPSCIIAAAAKSMRTIHPRGWRIREPSVRVVAMAIVLGFTLLCGSRAWAADPVPAPVPKTGQAVSFASRDDGDLRAGVPLPIPRFTDNRNGTVTDNLTGLLWLRDPGGAPNATWTNALDWCASLASGQQGLSDGSAAGDWRLPNLREAMSLVDFGRAFPALAEQHPFLNVPPVPVWTATTTPNRPDRAYQADFGVGSQYIRMKTERALVWAVRSTGLMATAPAPVPQSGAADIAGYAELPREDASTRIGVAWPSPRFSDLGNGAVRDNLTRLIWLKNGNAFAGRTWSQALAACATLAQGQQGLSDGSVAGDWRLPNVREMQTLLGLGNPGIPAGSPFTNVQSLQYWTSTTYQGSRDTDTGIFDKAFYVLGSGGIGNFEAKTATFIAWPVRGGDLGAPPAALPTIVVQPFPQQVFAGDQVVIQVEALANNGTLSYQWRKGTTVVGGDAPRLVIASAVAADAGLYSVIVSNSAGSVTSEAAALQVLDAPPENGRICPVPRTGQTASGGTGDDGALRTGVAWPSPRFTDNGNGTVTDRLSGLVWVRNPAALSQATWKEALAVSSGLGHGQAGLVDGSQPGQWRLPTRAELLSLVDYGRSRPALPSGAPFLVAAEGSYWASTVDAVPPLHPWFPPRAWYVTMVDGQIVPNDATSRQGVWPVRILRDPTVDPVAPVPRTGAGDLDGIEEDARADSVTRPGVAWPSPRFTDMGDGTVRDNLTNLYWLKNAGMLTEPLLWADALSACRNLASGQAGLSDGSVAGDWRLPSVREMLSLVASGSPINAVPNTEGNGPCTPGDPFTNLRQFYWTGTILTGGASAWSIDMENGQTRNPLRSTTFSHAWPVRNGLAIVNGPPEVSTATLSASTIVPGATVTLAVQATDDGLPASPGQLTYTWSVAVGSAAAVSFGVGNGSATGAGTTATVSSPGSYVFRVTVSDGQFITIATTPELLVTAASSPGVIAFTSPGQLAISEGNGGTTTAVLTLTRTGGSEGTVSVPFATSGGTAIAGSDFTAATGTVSWDAGDSAAKSISVQVTADAVYEANEQFTVVLGTPTGGATLGFVGTATVSIVNDDAAPSAGVLSCDPVAVVIAEGDTGSSTLAVTVTRQGGTAGVVSVQYATTNGTAQAGIDYGAASGTLTWAAGDAASKTFIVTVTGDMANEPDETILVALANPTGGALVGAGSAELTVRNDDAAVESGFLAFGNRDISQAEGAAGSSAVVFSVQRLGGSSGAVTAQYASGGGTATAGSDYTASSGTLSWAAGETAPKTITILVQGDVLTEGDETVILTLSSPTGGLALPEPTATLTIIDDDATGAVPGDLNGSGTVTFEDLSLFLSSYGRSVGDAGFLAGANLATAGSSAAIVDFEDLAAFLALYTP